MAAKPVPPRPVPRLYLATPIVDDPQALLASLPQLLAKADVAAVLLRLKLADPRTLISRIKALAPAIQETGAAMLLDGHVELVARAGADGAHLAGIEALQDALPTLKPDRIAGVGGLKSWAPSKWWPHALALPTSSPVDETDGLASSSAQRP